LIKKLLLIWYFLLAVLILDCLSMPYIIADNPAVFKDIERQLVTEEITTLAEDCKTIISTSSISKEIGTAIFYQGQYYALNGNYSLPENAYKEAITHFQSPLFEKGLAMVYYKLSELYFLQGNNEVANTYIKQAIGYAKKESLSFVLVDAYQIRANIYSIEGQTDSAQLMLKKALINTVSLPEKEEQKSILNQLATNYHATGQLDSAILYFKKSLLLKERINDVEGLISDYTALGNLHKERGSYELAQQQFIMGLRLAEELKDSFALMMIYTEIGGLYSTQRISYLAKENHQKGLFIARAKGNDFAVASCLRSLGDLAVMEKNKSQAITYYNESLGLYEQLRNKINAADIQVKLSECYQNNAQFPKAKAYLLEAIAIREQSRDRLSTLKAKLALGKLELSYGNRSKGILLVEECLASFEEMDDKEGLLKSYVYLANAYAKNNQPEKALRFYQTHTVLKDSLLALERTKVINELQKKYNTEKMGNAILENELKIELQQNEIQDRNNQLLMLGGGLILAISLLASLFFINKKNKELGEQRIKVLKKDQEATRLKTLIAGEEKERKRIGQELHDGLGAVLATVKMQINNIPTQLPNASENLSYQKAEQLIDDACQTVREISHRMMPYILEQEGLEVAIADLCQTLSNTKRLTIHFNPYQVDLIQSDLLKITLYRITQELLKNCITHANAQEVIVQLTADGGMAELVVEDDGKGFDIKNAKRGIGLENIQSRIKYLNGNLELTSQINQGSTFMIHIPLVPAE